MSFSRDVKSELCNQRPTACCRYAECYGMLLFGRSFCSEGISFLTADRATAEHLSDLLHACFDISVTISEGGVKKPTYLIVVDRDIDIKRLLIKYCRYGRDAFMGVNTALFEKECCQRAFIRGAFLACGSITDPEKAFHAEFALKNSAFAGDFYDVLCSAGLSPRCTERSGKSLIYFKNGADIEDLLTVMNDTVHSLELMNVQILKDMRNRTNRIKNCDNGNILRNVVASMAQCEAIKRLEESGRLETLPPELLEVALLRKNHPNDSLSELCKQSGNKISKSGINHRLGKITELAEKL